MRKLLILLVLTFMTANSVGCCCRGLRDYLFQGGSCCPLLCGGTTTYAPATYAVAPACASPCGTTYAAPTTYAPTYAAAPTMLPRRPMRHRWPPPWPRRNMRCRRWPPRWRPVAVTPARAAARRVPALVHLARAAARRAVRATRPTWAAALAARRLLACRMSRHPVRPSRAAPTRTVRRLLRPPFTRSPAAE